MSASVAWGQTTGQRANNKSMGKTTGQRANNRSAGKRQVNRQTTGQRENDRSAGKRQVNGKTAGQRANDRATGKQVNGKATTSTITFIVFDKRRVYLRDVRVSSPDKTMRCDSSFWGTCAVLGKRQELVALGGCHPLPAADWHVFTHPGHSTRSAWRLTRCVPRAGSPTVRPIYSPTARPTRRPTAGAGASTQAWETYSADRRQRSSATSGMSGGPNHHSIRLRHHPADAGRRRGAEEEEAWGRRSSL